MRRLLIIYNPSSGRSRKERAWHTLRELLARADFHIDTLDLQQESLQDAQFKTYDTLVVSGGDGTLRTVVQHLLERELDIPIALIPRGSANVLAKSLGLTFSLRKTAELIRKSNTTAIDVARVSTGHYFLAAFALGYLSHRVIDVNQKIKNILGFGGYVWSFLQQRRMPLHHFRFTVDGTSHAIEGHTLLVLNASNLFGFHSPHVKDLRDGVFELVVTTNRTFWSLIGLLYDFYFSRKTSSRFFLVGGTRFSIQCREKLSVQIDGEEIPAQETFDVSVLPKRQRFIIA